MAFDQSYRNFKMHDLQFNMTHALEYNFNCTEKKDENSKE